MRSMIRLSLVSLAIAALASGCGRDYTLDDEEDSCESDSDCAAGETCDADYSVCVVPADAEECTEDADCAFSLVCSAGSCVSADAADLENTDSSGSGGTGGTEQTGGVDSPTWGPMNPDLSCYAHDECGAGSVCCTDWDNYASSCETEAICTDGDPARRAHVDACLTNDQCFARDPNRPVCCHDRGDRNYCADPFACTPIDFCLQPEDCRYSDAGGCCSPHPYFQRQTCTIPQFAAGPQECL